MLHHATRPVVVAHRRGAPKLRRGVGLARRIAVRTVRSEPHGRDRLSESFEHHADHDPLCPPATPRYSSGQADARSAGRRTAWRSSPPQLRITDPAGRRRRHAQVRVTARLRHNKDWSGASPDITGRRAAGAAATRSIRSTRRRGPRLEASHRREATGGTGPGGRGRGVPSAFGAENGSIPALGWAGMSLPFFALRYAGFRSWRSAVSCPLSHR